MTAGPRIQWRRGSHTLSAPGPVVFSISSIRPTAPSAGLPSIRWTGPCAPPAATRSSARQRTAVHAAVARGIHPSPGDGGSGPNDCPQCRNWPPAIERALVLGPFAGVLREAVHAIKFAGHRRLAVELGRRLAVLPEFEQFDGIDLLVPVPLHPARQRERGFNQSLLIARGIAAASGKPVRDRQGQESKGDPSAGDVDCGATGVQPQLRLRRLPPACGGCRRPCRRCDNNGFDRRGMRRTPRCPRGFGGRTGSRQRTSVRKPERHLPGLTLSAGRDRIAAICTPCQSRSSGRHRKPRGCGGARRSKDPSPSC